MFRNRRNWQECRAFLIWQSACAHSINVPLSGLGRLGCELLSYKLPEYYELSGANQKVWHVLVLGPRASLSTCRPESPSGCRTQYRARRKDLLTLPHRLLLQEGWFCFQPPPQYHTSLPPTVASQILRNTMGKQNKPRLNTAPANRHH